MNSAPRMARRAIAVAALTGVATFVAACNSASTPTPTTTVTVTVAPHTSSAAPSAVAPVGNASQAPAGPGPCATSALKVKLGLGQGTAGSVYAVIDFTNISNASCTLYGYPGVSLTTGKPVAQIGQAAVENPLTPRRLVTLVPGATGNALLRVVDALNYPKSACDPVTAHYLQVYPPNQTTPVYLAYRTTACAKGVKLLTVNVVIPGSGG
jgi:Protein of unknown function (DUF4232)